MYIYIYHLSIWGRVNEWVDDSQKDLYNRLLNLHIIFRFCNDLLKDLQHRDLFFVNSVSLGKSMDGSMTC
jgi:hypothetical protein